MVDTKDIWEVYAEDVKRFILSKTKNDAMTDDLLQEVFIKVHTKVKTLQNLEKLKPWLFTIANNTVFDYFRSTQKNGNSRADIIDEIDVIDEDVVLLREHSEYDCLYGLIKNLPKKYRDPLFMADVKGLKQTEIARNLKLPLPTVKSQIQRARKMIAQGFMNCCGYELNEKGFLVGQVKSKDECEVCN